MWRRHNLQFHYQFIVQKSKIRLVSVFPLLYTHFALSGSSWCSSPVYVLVSIAKVCDETYLWHLHDSFNPARQEFFKKSNLEKQKFVQNNFKTSLDYFICFLCDI